MYLILVESPTKSKTLEKFLDKEYLVTSTMGHIRDLPKSKLGIKEDFEPEYVIPTKKRKKVNSLKKEAEKAEKIILATDEDREGEAIAWHISEILELKNIPHERIVFHEITEEAIKEAIKNPREINTNLVNAQQARRVLDRLVGYKLSPFLWKKVARGLSAGRVQSVALKLVVDREKEIKKFVPEEYWKIISTLQKENEKFDSFLVEKDEKKIPKMGIKTKKEAEKVLKELKEAKYETVNVKKKEKKKNPLPPFRTSTLQQESWKRFRFPAKFTMRLAQTLYEKGFITYHRTDSLNLSNFSTLEAEKLITKKYGKEYYPGFVKKYKSKGRAQEAHEAIRPTSPKKEPSSLKLKEKESKLYDLIWRRFMSSQMSPAVFDSITIDIKAENCIFRATGQTMKFEGFLKVYPIKFKENLLPPLKEREELKLLKLNSSQHFTKPPARYTEATLIKVLEKEGIGRPSTYAPIISNIQGKNYIEKEEGRYFKPTEIGTLITNLLTKHFPEIIDVNFTAKMEDKLDQVANGKINWKNICKDFYVPFEKNLKQKYEEVNKKDITEKPTDKKCPECKQPLIIRWGRFGKFYACSGFPKCRYTEPLEKKVLNIKCPGCEKGQITEKRTKKNKIFYGCDTFPKCDFALWDKPIQNEKGETEKCEECNSFMIKKYGKTRCSNKECKFNGK